MDLETENRIAAILMKEAAELRRQAEKDGVNAYFRPPNVRGRPNSRFLTATVLGVQQANRAVEVNEMWRIRQQEKELNDRIKKDEKRGGSRKVSHDSGKNRLEEFERKDNSLCSSSKRAHEDEGLRDNEIEEFLHSRVKRGRGAVGSRMDETGPYLPDSKEERLSSQDWGYGDRRDSRVTLGPEKPLHLKSSSSSGDESSADEERKAKRVGSTKHHVRRRRSEEKQKKKKKSRKDKKRSRSHK